MAEAFLVTGVRTPIGRYGGALAPIRPDDLAAHAIRALTAALPSVDWTAVDDVILGCANQAGEDNRNVARMAALLGGLPDHVSGSTVNRLCGSGLDAVASAARLIRTGEADLVIAGGVESMSRAPFVMPKSETAYGRSPEIYDTTLGWRLVNPRMPAEWTVSLGEGNEILADRFGIGRDRQDEFAARSHQLAHAAWEAGFYDDLVLPAGDLSRDEGIRPESTPATLAGLKPVFRPDGRITAGNASPLSDGASAVLIGSQAAGEQHGLEPQARIAGRGAYALEPQLFGFAPVEAANRSLARAGIDWADVGAVELNEAFAVQSLACVDAWKVDPEIVNTRGGAIALGHPLGASGGRLLGTLTKVLRERNARWGLDAICIGVGQGLAVVLENVHAEG